MTESPPNARDTYYDYLTPFSSKQASEKLLESNAPDFINTDFDYATVFVYAKKKGFWSKVTTAGALGTVGLVAGGTVAGFFTGGVGWIATGAVLLGTTGGVLGAAIGDDVDWQAGAVLVPFDRDSNSLKELGCEMLPVKQNQ